MGKKKIEEEPRKAILVMESESFKQALEQRIEAGKKLLEIKVTKNKTPYGMRGWSAYGGRFPS